MNLIATFVIMLNKLNPCERILLQGKAVAVSKRNDKSEHNTQKVTLIERFQK